MYEHYLLDNPDTKTKGAAMDSDYDDDLQSSEAEERQDFDNEKYNDTLPLPSEGETETFADPEFDAEWDNIDSDDVGENGSEQSSQPLGEGESTDKESPIEVDDWEEV